MSNLFFSFQVIYEGSSHFFKVNKLQETMNYNFRIYASNDVGSGPYSEIYTFTTTKAPPPAVRGMFVLKQYMGGGGGGGTKTSCLYMQVSFHELQHL